jgi:hypothetical protein
LEDYPGNENVILKNLTHSKILLETTIMKASTPLYEGFSTSMLTAMLLLLNLRTMHVVNNASMDELFSLLQKRLLPKDNKMPTSTYEAIKLIKAIGLSYDSIHACTNGCLFSKHLIALANVSQMWDHYVCGWVKNYSKEGLSTLPFNT